MALPRSRYFSSRLCCICQCLQLLRLARLMRGLRLQLHDEVFEQTFHLCEWIFASPSTKHHDFGNAEGLLSERANTQEVFVVEGETSRSHEIDGKGLQRELGSSDRSGKPDNLSENIELSKFTIDQGNLMSVTAQMHTQ